MITNVNHERKNWPAACFSLGVMVVVGVLLFWISDMHYGLNEDELSVAKLVTWVCVFACFLLIKAGISTKNESFSFTVDNELFEIHRSLWTRHYIYLHNGIHVETQESYDKFPYGKVTISIDSGRCVEIAGLNVTVDNILVISEGDQLVAELPLRTPKSKNKLEDEKTQPPVKNLSVYYLKYVDGPGAGRKYKLYQVHILGRDAVKCDIVLPANASEISRVHCRIEVEKNQINIVDLGSSNGTYVNGVRLAVNVPMKLYGGETITLGTKDCFVLEHN